MISLPMLIEAAVTNSHRILSRLINNINIPGDNYQFWGFFFKMNFVRSGIWHVKVFVKVGHHLVFYH